MSDNFFLLFPLHDLCLLQLFHFADENIVPLHLDELVFLDSFGNILGQRKSILGLILHILFGLVNRSLDVQGLDLKIVHHNFTTALFLLRGLGREKGL